MSTHLRSRYSNKLPDRTHYLLGFKAFGVGVSFLAQVPEVWIRYERSAFIKGLWVILNGRVHVRHGGMALALVKQ